MSVEYAAFVTRDIIQISSYRKGTLLRDCFAVTGNKITVVINEIEFVFKISNVLDVQEIICISTNLDTDSHGYFGEDTIFIL